MTRDPDLNDGKAWSEMDLDDLKGAVAYGRTLEETAEYRCRSGSPEDVAAKAKELGLEWRARGRRKPA